jgi:hypothetical protein
MLDGKPKRRICTPIPLLPVSMNLIKIKMVETGKITQKDVSQLCLWRISKHLLNYDGLSLKLEMNAIIG